MDDTARETAFLLISVPVYAVFILSEILLSNWQQKKYYSFKGVVQNIYLSLLNGGLDLLLRGFFYLTVLSFCYEYRLFNLTTGFFYWFFLFILEDLAFYIEHRVDHFCRVFWAVHVTHHSSEEFNLTTGFRSSVFQPVYRFIYFIPLVFIGFRPIDIVLMYSITQTYGILVHTQYIKKMPAWFEAILVSPSHHRVHHGSNLEYLDKNMGMCLIIWDKLFGTFQKELEQVPVQYGLTKKLSRAYHPTHIVFHEWEDLTRDLRRTNKFSQKLKYLFMPPGWSHDGSTKTAKALRAEMKDKFSAGLPG